MSFEIYVLNITDYFVSHLYFHSTILFLVLVTFIFLFKE